MVTETNWAGNYRYRAERIHHPRSVDELAALVAAASDVHILGSRHSFHDISDTAGDLISTAELPPTVAIDAANASVTIGAGVTYGRLAPLLHQAGWALHNLASLPAHQRRRRGRDRHARLRQYQSGPGRRGQRDRDPHR